MTHKDLFKGTTYDSLEKQVGGKHYRSMKIQPAEFINENKFRSRYIFQELGYIVQHQTTSLYLDLERDGRLRHGC